MTEPLAARRVPADPLMLDATDNDWVALWPIWHGIVEDGETYAYPVSADSAAAVLDLMDMGLGGLGFSWGAVAGDIVSAAGVPSGRAVPRAGVDAVTGATRVERRIGRRLTELNGNTQYAGSVELLDMGQSLLGRDTWND